MATEETKALAQSTDSSFFVSYIVNEPPLAPGNKVRSVSIFMPTFISKHLYASAMKEKTRGGFGASSDGGLVVRRSFISQVVRIGMLFCFPVPFEGSDGQKEGCGIQC